MNLAPVMEIRDEIPVFIFNESDLAVLTQALSGVIAADRVDQDFERALDCLNDIYKLLDQSLALKEPQPKGAR